jgi:hypothetical protein
MHEIVERNIYKELKGQNKFADARYHYIYVFLSICTLMFSWWLVERALSS